MRPSFRADQVGSLLRPPELGAARASWKRGELAAGALREIEDRAIRAAVARQEAIGLQAITDGEFRRDWWHLDFLAQHQFRSRANVRAIAAQHHRRPSAHRRRGRW